MQYLKIACGQSRLTAGIRNIVPSALCGRLIMSPHCNLSPALKIYRPNRHMRFIAAPAKKTTDLCGLKATRKDAQLRDESRCFKTGNRRDALISSLERFMP